MPTLAEGDLIVVARACYLSGATAPTAAYGTGFTAIGTTNQTFGSGEGAVSYRICLSYKVAGPSDSGAGIGGFMTTTGSGAYSILVYRPSGAIGTVTVQDVETAATGANPPAKTINAATSTKATVSVFGHVASNGTAVLNGPTPTTFSPTQDGSAVGSGSYYCLLYGLAQAEGAGSDVTADGSDGGVVNILVTAYLEVEP